MVHDQNSSRTHKQREMKHRSNIDAKLIVITLMLFSGVVLGSVVGESAGERVEPIIECEYSRLRSEPMMLQFCFAHFVFEGSSLCVL